MVRRAHRLIGSALALPLILWIATGLLFNVKHRYSEAYETLRVPAAPAQWEKARLSPAEVLERGLLDRASPLRLSVHPSGAVAYFGLRGGRSTAIDASTGEPLPEADELTARRWAKAAVAASPNAARYGNLVEISAEPDTHRSALTGGSAPAWVLAFDGGKRVVVDRVTGELSQSGDLNRWIDFTYRLHYLQWLPWKAANIAFLLLVALGVVGLVLTGLSWVRGTSR